MGKRVTLDSHALIWYIHKPSRQNLSANALEAIRQAIKVYIPTITLMEILRLVEKGKYPISFRKLIEAISLNKTFEIVPLTVDIVKLSERLANKDIHDRAIISTAIYTDTDLVSVDREISKVYKRVIW